MRTIDFPDGAACEVRDNDALDRLLPPPSPGHRLHRAVHLLESRLKFVAAAGRDLTGFGKGDGLRKAAADHSRIKTTSASS